MLVIIVVLVIIIISHLVHCIHPGFVFGGGKCMFVCILEVCASMDRMECALLIACVGSYHVGSTWTDHYWHYPWSFLPISIAMV